MFEEEAKARQREHGGTAPGREKTLSVPGRKVFVHAAAEAAKAVNVSTRSVEREGRGENRGVLRAGGKVYLFR